MDHRSSNNSSPRPAPAHSDATSTDGHPVNINILPGTPPVASDPYAPASSHPALPPQPSTSMSRPSSGTTSHPPRSINMDPARRFTRSPSPIGEQDYAPEPSRSLPITPRDERQMNSMYYGPPTPRDERQMGSMSHVPTTPRDERPPMSISIHGAGPNPRDERPVMPQGSVSYEASTVPARNGPIPRPMRAVSSHSGRPQMRDSRVASTSMNAGMSVHAGMGVAGMLADGNMSRSGLDYIVPTLPMNPTRASTATTDGLMAKENNVKARLTPTLESAEAELVKYELRAKVQGWALNFAIGAQVVLGALTTGVAAATSGKQTSIATSVLGGMSTLAASYLAKSRGSGEPETSLAKCKELQSFVRDCKACILDRGHMVGDHMDDIVHGFRSRFEHILGNNQGGVEEAIKEKV